MKYETANAFRDALETRLRAASRDQLALMRLRKTIVFDRLLARLLQVAPDQWVVKGGFALDLRLGDRALATKDLDLARLDDEAGTLADFRAAQRIDLGDFFAFNIERQSDLDELEGGVAIRFHVTAILGARTFEQVTVDIGFGGWELGALEFLQGANLLGFAGLAPILVPAITLEQQLARRFTHMRVHTATIGRVPASRT
jgi:Nucleotidyl transferase AbiEii toxin, Type IV TA system